MQKVEVVHKFIFSDTVDYLGEKLAGWKHQSTENALPPQSSHVMTSQIMRKGGIGRKPKAAQQQKLDFLWASISQMPLSDELFQCVNHVCNNHKHIDMLYQIYRRL